MITPRRLCRHGDPACRSRAAHVAIPRPPWRAWPHPASRRSADCSVHRATGARLAAQPNATRDAAAAPISIPASIANSPTSGHPAVRGRCRTAEQIAHRLFHRSALITTAALQTADDQDERAHAEQRALAVVIERVRGRVGQCPHGQAVCERRQQDDAVVDGDARPDAEVTRAEEILAPLPSHRPGFPVPFGYRLADRRVALGLSRGYEPEPEHRAGQQPGHHQRAEMIDASHRVLAADDLADRVGHLVFVHAGVIVRRRQAEPQHVGDEGGLMRPSFAHGRDAAHTMERRGVAADLGRHGALRQKPQHRAFDGIAVVRVSRPPARTRAEVSLDQPYSGSQIGGSSKLTGVGLSSGYLTCPPWCDGLGSPGGPGAGDPDAAALVRGVAEGIGHAGFEFREPVQGLGPGVRLSRRLHVNR